MVISVTWSRGSLLQNLLILRDGLRHFALFSSFCAASTYLLLL